MGGTDYFREFVASSKLVSPSHFSEALEELNILLQLSWAQ